MLQTPILALDDAKRVAAMLALPGAVPLEGGVPLLKDGRFAGGIGVSGVQSFQDGIIARAGAAAL
jgi:glc operon protein GlcG